MGGVNTYIPDARVIIQSGPDLVTGELDDGTEFGEVDGLAPAIVLRRASLIDDIRSAKSKINSLDDADVGMGPYFEGSVSASIVNDGDATRTEYSADLTIYGISSNTASKLMSPTRQTYIAIEAGYASLSSDFDREVEDIPTRTQRIFYGVVNYIYPTESGDGKVWHLQATGSNALLDSFTVSAYPYTFINSDGSTEAVRKAFGDHIRDAYAQAGIEVVFMHPSLDADFPSEDYSQVAPVLSIVGSILAEAGQKHGTTYVIHDALTGPFERSIVDIRDVSPDEGAESVRIYTLNDDTVHSSGLTVSEKAENSTNTDPNSASDVEEFRVNSVGTAYAVGVRITQLLQAELKPTTPVHFKLKNTGEGIAIINSVTHDLNAWTTQWEGEVISDYGKGVRAFV